MSEWIDLGGNSAANALMRTVSLVLPQGNSSDAARLQAALTAMAGVGEVRIGPGTMRITSAFDLALLQGGGVIVNCHPNTNFSVSIGQHSPGDESYSLFYHSGGGGEAATTTIATTAPTVGIASVKVASVSGIAVGDRIVIARVAASRLHSYEVRAIDGGTKVLTLDAPIVYPFQIGDEVRVIPLAQQCRDIKIYGNGASITVDAAESGCDKIVELFSAWDCLVEDFRVYGDKVAFLGCSFDMGGVRNAFRKIAYRVSAAGASGAGVALEGQRDSVALEIDVVGPAVYGVIVNNSNNWLVTGSARGCANGLAIQSTSNGADANEKGSRDGNAVFAAHGCTTAGLIVKDGSSGNKVFLQGSDNVIHAYFTAGTSGVAAKENELSGTMLGGARGVIADNAAVVTLVAPRFVDQTVHATEIASAGTEITIIGGTVKDPSSVLTSGASYAMHAVSAGTLRLTAGHWMDSPRATAGYLYGVTVVAGGTAILDDVRLTRPSSAAQTVGVELGAGATAATVYMRKTVLQGDIGVLQNTATSVVHSLEGNDLSGCATAIYDTARPWYQQRQARVATVAMADANQDKSLDWLTNACEVIECTGAMTAGRNLTIARVSGVVAIKNSTTGGFSVTVKGSSGTGVACAAGTTRVRWDGTDFARVGETERNPVALAYSATIATDASAGNRFAIVANNGTAYTISSPTNPAAGQSLTYDIKNSSGGVMGAITWGAAFLLAGAFTNPANTKRRTIRFYYDGTNWVEESRAAADI